MGMVLKVMHYKNNYVYTSCFIFNVSDRNVIFDQKINCTSCTKSYASTIIYELKDPWVSSSQIIKKYHAHGGAHFCVCVIKYLWPVMCSVSSALHKLTSVCIHYWYYRYMRGKSKFNSFLCFNHKTNNCFCINSILTLFLLA